MCKPNLPKRKIIRLKGFDYNTGATYFITICTHNRKAILSKIVGSIHESIAKIQLTENGRIVERQIKNLPERFEIKIDNYVIMPDHIHLLLTIPERSIRESTLRAKSKRSIMSKVIGYLKMNTSKEMHQRGYDGKPIWQRSYYDHIIRGQNDYNEKYEYIENNPTKWILTKNA